MKQEWEQAVHHGDTDRMFALIKAGADIDALDRYGQTALMIAARDGHAGIVDLLVAHGANLDVTAKYTLSALMLAVINRRADIAKVLVDAGADITVQGAGVPGFYGKNAAELAQDNGQPDVASYIRRASAESSGQTSDPVDPSVNGENR